MGVPSTLHNRLRWPPLAGAFLPGWAVWDLDPALLSQCTSVCWLNLLPSQHKRSWAGTFAALLTP